MAPSATAVPSAAPASEEYLTKAELAKLTRTSIRHLDRLDIPKIKLRNRVIYRRSTVDAYLAAQEAG